MLFSAITTLILSSASLVAASGPSRLSSEGSVHLSTRRTHRQVARTFPAPQAAVVPLKKRSTPKKRTSCQATHSTGSSNSTASTSTTDNTGSTGSSSGNNGDSGSGSSTSTHTSTNTQSSGGSGPTGLTSSSGGTQSGGVVHITDPKCGPNNPSSSTTKSAGPNGEEAWFNCGLDSGGWTPPMMKLEEMIYVTLEDALQMSGTPYKACSAHVDLFNTYGSKYKLPPIMLASFAMQESGCSQSVSNPAGTIGMFQLAPENCKGVNCNNLETNIDQACKLIIQYLSDAGQNVLGMVGAYNGWYNGITANKAKKAPCDQQQNLDYLQQWANAWMQGHDGYGTGTIQNCSGNFGQRKRSLFIPRFARRMSDAVREIGWHF